MIIMASTSKCDNAQHNADVSGVLLTQLLSADLLQMAQAPDEVLHPYNYYCSPRAPFVRFEWWLAKYQATEEYRMYMKEYVWMLTKLRADHLEARKSGTLTELQEAVADGKWLSSITCNQPLL